MHDVQNIQYAKKLRCIIISSQQNEVKSFQGDLKTFNNYKRDDSTCTF